MNKKKQILYTTAGIFLICLLFALAMIFPEYYTSYTDKNLFGKMEYVDVKYNAYEVTYNSFAEKLNAIAKMINTGSINSVKLNNGTTNINYKNINKIVRKEFNELLKYELLYRKMRLRAGKIISCEKYMLYPSDGKDDIKGITYIKVVYKTKKGNIEVYIDEEYHKVYETDIPYDLYLGKASKVKGYNISTYGKSLYDEIDYSYFQIMNGLLKYYTNDEPNNVLNVSYDSIMNAYYSGNIEFNDGTVLEAGRRKVIMLQEDFTIMRIGINLKDI